MIKKLHFFLFLLLVTSQFISSRSLFGQPIQYENQNIEKIDVLVMNLPCDDEFDSSAVLSRIKTKKGDFFSQTEFDNDLKILATEFDRIEPKVESHDGKVFITLRIWPKPKIRSLIWNGNHRIKTKRLQKELEIGVGCIFDRLEFNKAFHKIKAFYVKKGYFEAQLYYDVHLDEVTNEVDIEIHVCEGRSGRVKCIVFHDFTKQEEHDILEQMITKKWNIFTSWFNNEGTYHEEAVQQDKLMILNYLQNEGYADAKVDLEVCEADSSNRIIIHVTAYKGQRYTIDKILFKGNCLFSNEQICENFTVSPGDYYSPEDIRETIDRITALYGNRGYIDAYVDYEPRLGAEECSYTIYFNIEEGEQYHIGMIKVLGNCNTQTNTILHEVVFAPGEVFNMGKLRKTEEKLRNIGYFSCVNVYAVKSDADYGCEGNFRDVHIEVEETGTGQFGAFAGFSTVESIFGGVSITEKNFNYKGIPRIWRDGYSALRGAGEYAHITATIGARNRKYMLSWTKPFFMDTKWSVGFDIENSSNRYISREYEINALGFSLHANYLINQFVRFGCHYRLRNTQVHISDDNPPEELVREAKNSGLVSATGVTLAYDSRDCPNKTHDGYLSRLQFEYAGLGGHYTFASFAYLNSYYLGITENGVLKYRADMKFLQPIGNTTAHNLPLDERFFLGGDDCVRGYRPYAIGPHFSDGAPMGGISLTQFSLEYNYILTKRIDLFLFADAGSLSEGRWEFSDLKVALGYGVRLIVFEGGPALTLGMGYPLNPSNHTEVKRFFFQIGARF